MTFTSTVVVVMVDRVTDESTIEVAIVGSNVVVLSL
jgi:hypothetical protein